MRRQAWLLVVMLVMGHVVVTPPPAAMAQVRELTPKQRADKERREKKALADFSAGKYQEAIDAMAELYADFQEPMYYRNIGRCYQKLGDPDRAIAAFEEYLNKAKDASPASVAETKDLIRQMQELKQKRAAEKAPPPPPPPPPEKVTPEPPVQPTQPTQTGSTTPGTGQDTGPVLVEKAPPPVAAPSRTGKVVGYVLLGTGAVVAGAGGAVLATSWSEYNKAKMMCPNPTTACTSARDTVKSRNTLSMMLFIGGAVVAATGGVLIAVSPSSSSSASLSDGVTVAFTGRF
jgi:hypothetical protein